MKMMNPMQMLKGMGNPQQIIQGIMGNSQMMQNPMTEIINDATPEEKTVLRNKLSALVTKIG